MVARGGLGLGGAHEAPLLQAVQGGRQHAAATDAAAAIGRLALPRRYARRRRTYRGQWPVASREPFVVDLICTPG